METTTSISNPINLSFLIDLMGLVPFFLTLATSYIKIIVVTYLIRNALGIQQVPPGMVLSGLAMILSIFVMAPVGVKTYDLLQQQDVSTVETSPYNVLEIADNVSGPLKNFLQHNTDERILNAFTNTAQRIWPQEIHNVISKDSLIFIIPSFVISELTKAFQIGFLLYLPFIAIDLIISNILLAMGMMMVSPMTISLPFKIMLFVTLDGWLKLSQGLLYSYSY